MEKSINAAEARVAETFLVKTRPSGRFEVTDHFELQERGAFVVGIISEGLIKPGDSALLPDGSTLRIRGVEFIDSISERKHHNALIFQERPALAALEQAFPVGYCIEVYDEAQELE